MTRRELAEIKRLLKEAQESSHNYHIDLSVQERLDDFLEIYAPRLVAAVEELLDEEPG